jgi:hypothetical protein
MAKDTKEGKGGRTLAKKSFSLSNFKALEGFNDEVKDKDLVWIPLSDAYQQVTGLPGIPKGYVSLARGFSNTGKSTTMMELIRGCQQMGILPVIIDTENNFSWEHAREIGIEFNEVCNEHGEIVSYDGDFIYVNNEILISKYGRKRDKNCDEAVIEDVAELTENLLDMQKKGDLPYELCFMWDSIGTLDCLQCITSKSRNNMWNAGALETSFKTLVNGKIPSSRKESRQYTNTFFAVQKIWIDSMQGAGVIKHKGGEAFFYAARLILHFGGIQSHGTARLSATANKRDYSFGIETKLEVFKNQVTGISYKGKIISTPHGFIASGSTNVEKYKNDHKDYLIRKLELLDDAEITIKVENVTEKIDTSAY